MKKIFIVLASIMFIMCLTGCKKEYSDDSLELYIKLEYKDKFENQEFTMTDFKYDNLKSFRYYGWYDDNDNDESYGIMFIYLQKAGQKEIKKAIKHFEKLEFVKDVKKDPLFFALE